jgi:hypothetical protein
LLIPVEVSRYRTSPVIPGRSTKSVIILPEGVTVRCPGWGRFPPDTKPNNLSTSDWDPELTFMNVEFGAR